MTAIPPAQDSEMEEIMRVQKINGFVSVFALLLMLAGSAFGQTSREAAKQCRPIGGTVMTNLGVVDENTTLGSATGDLKGAVSATIRSIVQNADGTVSFTVQHHFVTESGDTITVDLATAVTQPVSPTLFAILSYPVHITGGTGKYAKATGDLTNIGEVDLASGTTVFRYSGKVCGVSN
jgi:hypothetical protein